MDRPPVVPVGIIVASFAAAFVLTGLPMAGWAAPWRPPWVALVLLYWCFAVPERVGVLAGWGCGLVLDVLVGTLVGQHALALGWWRGSRAASTGACACCRCGSRG